MRLKYIQSKHLDLLRGDIASNAQRYGQETPWLSDYFQAQSPPIADYAVTTAIEVEKPRLVLSGDERDDLQNAIELYSKMRGLEPVIASDERIWAWMTHEEFWEYMRQRWPVSCTEKSTVTDRYFFMKSRGRGFLRNGISRLWWYGHLTYDDRRDDPFELTRVLLEKQSTTVDLLERSFSRNRSIMRAVLEALAGTGLSRDELRELMKHIDRIGGTAVLDCIPEERMSDIIRSKIKEIKPQQDA